MKHPPTPQQVAEVPAKPSGFAATPLFVFSGATLIGTFLLIFLWDLLYGLTQDTAHLVAFGVAFYLAGATLAGFRLSRDFPHRALGLCNLVTLGRLMIVGLLCAVVLAGFMPNWAAFGIATLALALDGIDGWLARRQGLASDFGADFDVEVDAALALVLAIYAASNGAAGLYVILLGLPHYLFRIARLRLPWLNGPLRPSLGRKTVCVFQIGVLIAIQIPLLANGTLDLLIAAVALALVWSFGRDIHWLWRAGQADR